MNPYAKNHASHRYEFVLCQRRATGKSIFARKTSRRVRVSLAQWMHYRVFNRGEKTRNKNRHARPRRANNISKNNSCGK